MSLARYLSKLGQFLNSSGQVNIAGHADASVTYAKMQSVAAGKVLGRDTSGAGVVQELPIAVAASGYVGVGTITSPNVPLEAPDTIRATGANATLDANAAGGTAALTFRHSARYWRWISSAGDDQAQLVDETAGAVRLKVDSGGNFKFNSGYGSAATAYGCRAWVNFNGTGTVAIRGSGNVSSITDNGVGNYTVNFSTAMPDANYALGLSAGMGDGTGVDNRGPVSPGTSGVQVQTTNNGQTSYLDAAYVSVTIFR